MRYSFLSGALLGSSLLRLLTRLLALGRLAGFRVCQERFDCGRELLGLPGDCLLTPFHGGLGLKGLLIRTVLSLAVRFRLLSFGRRFVELLAGHCGFILCDLLDILCRLF